jgi:hypothetical protein
VSTKPAPRSSRGGAVGAAANTANALTVTVASASRAAG